MNKFAVIFLVLCLSAINTQNVTLSNKIKNFAMGLCVGMGALKYMPDALTCISETTPVMKDIQTLLNDLKDKKFNIFKMIEEVKTISQEFTKTLSSCKNLSKEGQDFFGNILNHFVSFKLRSQGYINILSNFKNVQADFSQGTTAFNTGVQETDFLASGAKFGDIVKIFVQGNKSSLLSLFNFHQLALENKNTALTKLGNFSTGFLLGSQALAQIPHIQVCVSNTLALYSESKEFIFDIETSNILDILKDFYEMIPKMHIEEEACKQFKSEFIAYGSDVKQAFNNHTRIVQGEKNIINQIQNVENLVQQAFENIVQGEDSNFNRAGFQLGNIFQIYLGQPSTPALKKSLRIAA